MLKRVPHVYTEHPVSWFRAQRPGNRQVFARASGLLHMALLEELIQDLGERGVCVHIELQVLHRLLGGDGVGGLRMHISVVRTTLADKYIKTL